LQIPGKVRQGEERFESGIKGNPQESNTDSFVAVIVSAIKGDILGALLIHLLVEVIVINLQSAAIHYGMHESKARFDIPVASEIKVIAVTQQ
jgi:hypothetical protein